MSSANKSKIKTMSSILRPDVSSFYHKFACTAYSASMFWVTDKVPDSRPCGPVTTLFRLLIHLSFFVLLCVVFKCKYADFQLKSDSLCNLLCLFQLNVHFERVACGKTADQQLMTELARSFTQTIKPHSLQLWVRGFHIQCCTVNNGRFATDQWWKMLWHWNLYLWQLGKMTL